MAIMDTDSAADEDTAATARSLLARLAQQPAAVRMAAIADPRRLHRQLFRSGGLRGGEAGVYRHRDDAFAGKVAVLTAVPGGLLRAEGYPADAVPAAMRRFRDGVRAILALPPPDVAQRSTALAHLYARFALIHPFHDGNGRTGRVLVTAAAAEIGCPLDAAWLDRRHPHGPAFSLALRVYPQDPGPFLAQMRRHLPGCGP